MERRTFIRSAAWAAPVIAVAVATPLAAASTPPTRNRIRFTNATATEGREANTVYANTKVQVIDGPEPVTNVVLTVTANGETRTHVWGSLAGWGNTEKVAEQFQGVPKGAPVLVAFTATADGCTPISAQVAVKTPGWWT